MSFWPGILRFRGIVSRSGSPTRNKGKIEKKKSIATLVKLSLSLYPPAPAKK
jgi:hypothetical protein